MKDNLESIRHRVNIKQTAKGVWQKDITIEIENGQGVLIYNDPEDVMHDMKRGSIKDQIKDQLIQINAGATEAIKEMGGKLADEIEVKE